LGQSIKNSGSSWTPALHGCGCQAKLVLTLLNAQGALFRVESPILLRKKVVHLTLLTVRDMLKARSDRIKSHLSQIQPAIKSQKMLNF
jgi:hypothetical protein